jgi:hypothetical protein
MILREGLAFGYLSFQEQILYRTILAAFSSMAMSFVCPQASRNVDLTRVINAVLGDNPSVIYFNKTKIEIEESIIEKRVKFTGICLKPQADQMNMSLEVTANLIASSIRAISNDDYALLVNLYEFLQKNVRYDNEEMKASSRGIIMNPSSHNAYGALVNKLAVCDGFSAAFALLSQKLGFDCMLVIGDSVFDSSSVKHAWNIIRLQGESYHMDVTWDTRKYNDIEVYSYSYFAVADGDIASDHTWDREIAPVCSDDSLDYYVKNGVFADSLERLMGIIRSHAKRQSNVFQVKLSSNLNIPSGKVGEYIASMVIDELSKVGQRVQIGYTWNAANRCFLAKTVIAGC